MDISYYVAAQGASSYQQKLDHIANNLANINNDGYKTQTAGFVDLLYDNINRPSGEDTHLKQGSGTRVEKTDISFVQGMLKPTDNPLDFAISGDGFFALMNPTTQDVFYTRKGSFKMAEMEDGTFNLVADNGYFVLDDMGEAIKVQDRDETPNVAVYDFPKKEGFVLVANNLFSATPRNGAATVKVDAVVKNKYLEGANVDLAKEMARVIEAQRAYQMSLKMVQTSDEVVQTVNSLR